MERTMFQWLTGAGVIAALITFAVDTWGVRPPPQAPNAPATAATSSITILVVERNGAKLMPYAVCAVTQVGE